MLASITPHTEADTVAVLYLARGIGAGLKAVDRFIEAYNTQPAQHDHQICFLLKGWVDSADEAAVVQRARSIHASVLHFPDTGFDWGAYFSALPHVNARWICLLNSFSEPQVSGWLRLLVKAAAGKGQGIAGATGSWESIRTRQPADKGSFTRSLQTLRTIRYWTDFRHFYPFPNPHLRSTGIVVRRDLLADFARANKSPMDKMEALKLESGNSGLSRFAEQRGARLVVAGSDGNAFAKEEWPGSLTFRSGRQENLIISDNRTRDYAAAAPNIRSDLEERAWGRSPGEPGSIAPGPSAA